MLGDVFRLRAEAGPDAEIIIGLFAVAVVVLLIYLGIAMAATLRATDDGKREMSYKMFRDLIGLFRRGDRS